MDINTAITLPANPVQIRFVLLTPRHRGIGGISAAAETAKQIALAEVRSALNHWYYEQSFAI